ncbi:MAG: KTSC domain-containing protein [Aurantimonas endophytica]|uniref:KTSC domain-containing protein n=1 Tax=Aurantimonas endophytica TaxID=1522175 RepID=UPI0030039CF9
MERKPVISTSIASIGYDELTQVLEVEFIKTGVYQYFNVPAPTHEALMTAPSHGGFLNTNIKGQFPCERL